MSAVSCSVVRRSQLSLVFFCSCLLLLSIFLVNCFFNLTLTFDTFFNFLFFLNYEYSLLLLYCYRVEFVNNNLYADLCFFVWQMMLGEVDPAGDVYGMGVLIYILLTGTFPLDQHMDLKRQHELVSAGVISDNTKLRREQNFIFSRQADFMRVIKGWGISRSPKKN